MQLGNKERALAEKVQDECARTVAFARLVYQFATQQGDVLRRAQQLRARDSVLQNRAKELAKAEVKSQIEEKSVRKALDNLADSDKEFLTCLSNLVAQQERLDRARAVLECDDCVITESATELVKEGTDLVKNASNLWNSSVRI